ncbi:hypothetical protein TNIN_92121 [Trichonephila inaurata madagascariensis]|uniref:Uncharacterized protein n=1 Tax=Trichonephila inaurata madagascariensis TaxID=2747483 RepID=A0A8X6YVQ9_9ARAC|nr:hypothetical protein TNIN_92121 [Trichonephila inaurata madagascariensis]
MKPTLLLRPKELLLLTTTLCHPKNPRDRSCKRLRHPSSITILTAPYPPLSPDSTASFNQSGGTFSSSSLCYCQRRLRHPLPCSPAPS